MTPIGWIWITFIFIFVVLAVFHFIASYKKVSHFIIEERPMSKNVTVQIAGSDIDSPIMDHVEKFNFYIDSYNNSTSLQNKLAGFGYLAAALIALISFFMEIKII